MKNIKVIKVVLVLLVVGIFSFLSYQYYQYKSLQEFMDNYEKSFEENLVVESMTSTQRNYGEVWPTNRTQLDSMLEEIKHYRDRKSLFLEKYGYGFQIDTTVKIGADTLKYDYVEYKLYSYGPDRKDDDLKYLPFNTDSIIEDYGKLKLKEVSFLDYLFMDKNFDIIVAFAPSYFDCVHKRSRYSSITDQSGVETKIKAVNVSRMKYTLSENDHASSLTNPDQEIEITDRFNQTLQTIQKTLSEQYPDLPTEGLIFNYNGKRVKCICSFNLPNGPVTKIEKILTEELNTNTDSIGMTVFYMEVPVLDNTSY